MKPTILLCGRMLTRDQALLTKLRADADISHAATVSSLDSQLLAKDITLIVCELSEAWQEELETLESFMLLSPKMMSVVVCDSESVSTVTRAFQAGAKDCFSKPYRADLLAERIKALLQSRVAPAGGVS